MQFSLNYYKVILTFNPFHLFNLVFIPFDLTNISKHLSKIKFSIFSSNREDFWKTETQDFYMKNKFDFWLIKLGNLFGSLSRREKMEKFGYESAATFKVLPTWPFSSLFSWMDRRKRITEGESPGTALPQLATASDRWTTQLDTARQSYRRNFYPRRIRTRVNQYWSMHRVMQLLMSLTTVQTYLSFKFLFLNIALLFFLFFEGTGACLVKI